MDIFGAGLVELIGLQPGRRARLHELWDRTRLPAIEEIRVPAVSSWVALSKHERIWLHLVLDLVQVELVLNENVWKADRVRAWAWAGLNITFRVADVRAWLALVEVFAVPAVWKVNGAVEAGVGVTIADTSRKASILALVRRSTAVADPFRDGLVR
ncbi:hypothetical protein AC579_9355 [Pseudocercospora musae]|uniref:Uncharacterized protein n=1 Tax=Pseudocercospora musae TaxID=113226 RepID=A0A139I2J2_9PEZI|nr:hypothetical protein AC579_9355 [Pseudocercospora musae]